MKLEDKRSPIFVAGHRGLVGSAVVRVLKAEGYDRLILRTSSELDLRDQAAVQTFFAQNRPEYVVLAAARVGGILANNTFPADFISDNLAIQDNVIRTAHDHQVKRLIFLGSSCIYPKLAPQPMKEDYLLTGPLEPTNQWYAVAKIAGTKLCEAYREQYGDDFITLMPTNLFGPQDNYDLATSHVLAALIRKFHDARRSEARDEPVTLWGTGTPRREFLYSDDLADAVLFALRVPEEKLHDAARQGMLNVGVGKDVTITELAETIRDLIGSTSEIQYDGSKPDGAPRKLLDISRMTDLGWKAKTSLREGIRKSYDWFVSNVEAATN